MSYIPDCRSDENYNQKYLNDKDKEFLRGFDWSTENATDNFFDNLDVYFNEDDYIMHVLNEELPEYMISAYETDFTFNTNGTRQVLTYGDLLRQKILHYIEMERDELITSMIDNMDEDEYKAIKEKVDGQSETEN